MNGIDWFVQKALIKSALPELVIQIYEGGITKVIEFSIKLPNRSSLYDFKIVYYPFFKDGVQLYQPELFCKNRDIIRDIDNHINSEGQVCYFYPGDLSPKSGISCSYAILAAIKWADCYDYWFKNQIGKWACAEMPHGSYVPDIFGIHRPMIS